MILRRFLLALVLACMTTVVLADSYEASISSARLGDTRQLVSLLNRGIDPNTIDEQGNSLLLLAAREGHLRTVQAILQYRPNVLHRNLAGDSALMLATLGGHRDVVDELLDAGAELNHDGWTPLIYAAFQGHLDLVEKFIERGADVHALAPNESNALMFAARNGHIQVVRRLLQTDIDLYHQNDRGFTAETWALSSGNTDIARLIEQERERRRPIRLEIN
ncbi:ankyrin repeat domain-containing protein [Azoarcus taiwanensis]|uniref:Ankyrin n=1 Tax=Azoarcus taiwanensis TaxID=666964 RepID=A0A972F8U1_9RHOO|nr:ankyrin repeat domain-containing protein [Azoarcus taiwanensis]NMG02069.1 hypothetical protein [Azoarcus taiwanensis]